MTSVDATALAADHPYTPGAGKSACIITKLSRHMAENDSIKAVWLDAASKKVSFAFQPDIDSAAEEKRLRDIVGVHRPGLPDCAEDEWQTVCHMCELGMNQPLPRGIRMLPMPGAGVMLEKESCPTAPRFWRWQVFTWVRVKPRGFDITRILDDVTVWQRQMLAAVVCGLTGIVGFILDLATPGASAGIAPVALFVASYIAGGWYPAQEVWENLKEKVLDVHFLMLAVALGAAFLGHWGEGAALLFLFSLSGALEELAMARTEREIKSLFKEAPKEATVVVDGGEERRVAVDDLKPGMLLRVLPGEQFPVDAIVTEGNSAADESSLTGESDSVEKNPGDPVMSGTINVWGAISCKVERPASESSLAKIIRLIRDAQASKAPAQQFTDQFGTRYTYGILGLCLVMFFVWWLGFGLSPFAAPAGEPSAFYRAMTLLVVASPCALVLSIPSAILAGIARGARQGILFRGGAALQRLGEIDRVALDKTGTLTTGKPAVERIDVLGETGEADLLRAAASLAKVSTHPVSRAIVSAYHERAGKDDSGAPGLLTVADDRAEAGMGLTGKVEIDGRREDIFLGSRRMFAHEPWVNDLPDAVPGASEAIIAVGQLRGRIVVRDQIRDGAKAFIADLHKGGLRVSMLTGDREEAATEIARELAIDDVQAGLSPDEKLAAVRGWSASEKVAMVGDGVNDAPCLAAAHVSFGMGMRGSDAALEQADIVLSKDKISGVHDAYRLSKRARAIIFQNLGISLGMIAILVGFALVGSMPLTLGVLGHEGSTVVVVLNSLRLLVK